MSQKVAIVYVTYDGAVNSASGVGVLSQYFISAMPKTAEKIAQEKNCAISFHVVAVELSKEADGYSESVRANTESVCQSLDGKLHLIENGLKGLKGYGWLENWQLASKNAAAVIEKLCRSYDRVLVYLIDTPFMCLPFFVKQSSKITLVIVPHSDTFSHFPDNIDLSRLGWEAAAMQVLNVFPNAYLAKTSDFLLRTLKDHYKIDDGKVVSLQTGLVPQSSRFSRATATEIKNALQDRKIPPNKPLIFSVGRAVPYKGFADLIESFALFAQKDLDAHLVFVAPPHKNEAGITGQLEALIAKHGLRERCTPIYELDMELPRLICQWDNTKIVAQLSHREPFGLVPEEVRLWAKDGGPVIVASNLDGFIEQITDGMDGFLVMPDKHEMVADAFHTIFSMESEELSQIRQAGWARAVRDYDYAESVMKSIEALLSNVS